MRERPIISIDPGASGGIAWRAVGMLCYEEAICEPIPATEGDVVDRLRSLKADMPNATVFIEDVGGYCGAGQPGSAMFKFGLGCGILRGACMALGFRVELVKPQKWQKHFSLGTSKQAGGKTAWKNKLKSEAQRRFPTLAVTLKTADALLILDYATDFK